MAGDAERRARNEAIFRQANEEIEAVRSDLSAVEGRTPFFCECSDPRCREIVRLGLDEYEAVRASSTAFVVARGHSTGGSRVVGERDGYLVVEKQGEEGRVAAETDPRKDDE